MNNKNEIELKCKCGGRIVPMIDLKSEYIFFKCLKCGSEYTYDDLADMFKEELAKHKKNDEEECPCPYPVCGCCAYFTDLEGKGFWCTLHDKKVYEDSVACEDFEWNGEECLYGCKKCPYD